MRTTKWRSALTVFIGPFATLTTALALEAISKYFRYPIPAPGAFLLLMVSAGAYVGGTGSGLLCAMITTIYALYVAGAGSATLVGSDAVGRAIVLGMTAFAMAILVGLLRRRTMLAESKRIEAVQQLSDRRFSLLFDASPVGILISRNTVVLHANPAFFEAFGYPPEEVLQKSFAPLLAPSVRDEIIERTQMREAGVNVPPAYETVGLRSDGTEFPFLVHVTRLDLSDGPATLAFITDITDRRNAEQEVIQVLRNTEFSLNSARIGSWQLELGTRALTASALCKANFGLKLDEPLDLDTFFSAIHSEDRVRVETAIREAIDSHKSFDIEYRVQWNDGTQHWIVARGRCMYSIDGRPIRMAGITLDVTERHMAAAELRLSQERLSLAIEGAGLGTWYRDLPSNMMVWNDKCKEHFGLSHEAAINADVFYAHIHPEDRDRTRQSIEEAIAKRTIYDNDYRTISPTGRLRWIRATGRCSYDSGGRPIRFDGITIDLTERKRFEQELEQARKAAETANAAKDHFLAVLSHELRTPLTPVLASVQMMSMETDLSATLRESVEVIRRNVELEARLIDDLLDLTRIARGKLRLEIGTVDAHELLRQAISICMGELNRKKLRLTTHLDAASHHVLADPARLQQVYWNLINNAVKFTPEGGEISVTSKNPDGGGQFSVTVADNGIGIEQDALPRLFHAFEQAEEALARRFGGLGLGLTISKTIVEMHGGSMSAESDGPGRGAKFTVQFSTVLAPQLPPPTPAPTRRLPSHNGLTILLVDDHVDTNRVLRRLLQQLGFEVHCAYSMKSALEAADAGTFDLLISDIGLPDGSGLELMRQLLSDARKKPLKGIALSGFGMEEDVRKSLEAGFKDHLTKPVSFQKLEAAIRELTDAER